MTALKIKLSHVSLLIYLFMKSVFSLDCSSEYVKGTGKSIYLHLDQSSKQISIIFTFTSHDASCSELPFYKYGYLLGVTVKVWHLLEDVEAVDTRHVVALGHCNLLRYHHRDLHICSHFTLSFMGIF